MPHKDSLLEDNPCWYRDAIIYQVHIKAFADSDADGSGDFRGLIGKLDYLQQLGVTALWLLPFYPSPQRDDGYDIADYYTVNPTYNTLREFKQLLRSAHSRGIRVITELVLNHTSDQHPWFQRARRAKPGSVYRDFYVWSDTTGKYREARIIFQDFETSNWTWDPLAGAYFWHRFYYHQPDLNFDNPRVQSEMLRVIDFWMRLGVDGVRLDAVPYLFEREGTNCENLPETHAFLKKLRSHLDSSFKNRLLLSEANQWPEDAAAYFGDGDESNMAFHFPLMPRMFMAIEMEDRFPIIDIIDQTPAIPDGCQWAIFLRNHDELTLEMVTDEERDYMYRVYASDPRARINLGIRRRLAPLMGNNRRKIELMNILLFSLPGTPIIYYGDEIGMGDNYYLGDRNGVRTPMQWNPDRNAGFSKASPQKLFLPVIIEPEYHYESINVENQERNSSSLLWWMRRTIAMRKRFKAFGCGVLEMLPSDNPKVLTFIRSVEDEKLLVVINLSRFSQTVTVDLSSNAGMIPEEVFSRNRFPMIQETRYHFTMGPYDYFWFVLRSSEARTESREEGLMLKLREGHPWWDVLKGKVGERLCSIVMPQYLQRVFWFSGKGRIISQISVVDSCQLRQDDQLFLLAFIQVTYTEWDPEIYQIPMTWLSNERLLTLTDRHPLATITALVLGDVEGVLCDAIYFEEFRELLFELMSGRAKVHGANGSELLGMRGGGVTKISPPRTELFPSRVATVEQSNTSILYGERMLFKMYRKLQDGVNPEPEILRFLADKKRFRNVPAYAGGIKYHAASGRTYDLGVLQTYIPSHGDAWRNTMTSLTQFVEHLLSHKLDLPKLPSPLPTLLGVVDNGIPDQFRDLVRGLHMEMALLLGRRTAEMHRALASSSTDSAWGMEEFSTLYQRSIFQSMRGVVRRNFQKLAANLHRLPDDVQQIRAAHVLGAEKEIIACLQKITGRRLSAMKCRIHGDFHLGQALFTGKDFAFIDFEGAAAHSLSERRLKRSPLRDVAGMIHSFHYAAMTALVQHGAGHSDDIPLLEPWLEAWYVYVSGSYLKAYLHAMKSSPLIPEDREELAIMLRCFLIDKVVHELGYELNNRPDWVDLPLRGIEMLMRECRCSVPEVKK